MVMQEHFQHVLLLRKSRLNWCHFWKFESSCECFCTYCSRSSQVCYHCRKVLNCHIYFNSGWRQLCIVTVLGWLLSFHYKMTKLERKKNRLILKSQTKFVQFGLQWSTIDVGVSECFWWISHEEMFGLLPHRHQVSKTCIWLVDLNWQ